MNLGFFFSLKISKYFVNGVHKNCERRSQNCERRSQFQIVNGSARHPKFTTLLLSFEYSREKTASCSL